MKKSNIKKNLKPVVRAADIILSNRTIKKVTTRAAKIIIDRYTNNGSDIEVNIPSNYAGSWNFMLDTPKLEKTSDKKAYISGWFVPNDNIKYQLRLISPSGIKTIIRSDIKRYDVAETLSERLQREVKVNCGFGKNIVVTEDGEYYIEAKLTSEWKRLTKFNLRYDPDFIVSDIYNGNLAYNYASHLNLISNKKSYFYEKETFEEYVPTKKDVKLIAFYLPQYHPFKENNEWWGKGFTEWTNVSSAVPRFVGHEQPKLPADLGFYDLRIADNMKNQIDMAKKYGVHAFCFYYYWFSGSRLMEKPIDTFLKHKEWNFNFMICWANENWTRRWDGRNEDVLIAQKHNPDDPLKFIKDVEAILLDERYMRVDGKPVLAIYRAKDLDNKTAYVKIWRDYFKQNHNLDLHLLAVQSFSNENPQEFGFDKGIEFAPLSISARLKKDIPRYNIINKILDVEFTGAMYDYRPIALNYYNKRNKFPAYRSVMPAWDNDARRKGSGGVFANANPDLYGHWLNHVIYQAKEDNKMSDQRLVFINAWNEWAEGAYLEPDTMYGHSYLNRTAQILALHSNNPDNKEKFPLYGIKRSKNTTLAVILHLFYPDMWEEFKRHFKKLEIVNYDLYVTIPQKAEYIKAEILKFNPNAQVISVPNRGRDVLPFLHLGRRLHEVGYETFLKMHSKKSVHRKDGNLWINDMLKKLIPSSKQRMDNLMRVLNSKHTGIVGPQGHYISLEAYFGSNQDNTSTLLRECIGEKATKDITTHLGSHGFFAGTMFWGRFDAVSPILDRYYQASDFEAEAGQVDGTFAHATERVLTVAPRYLGKKIYSTDQGRILTVTGEGIAEDYNFAKNRKDS